MENDDDDALLREIAAAPAVAIPQDLARFVLLEPGTIVDGNFRIESRLGAGGMGVVYAARDLTLDREIALKLLRIDRGPAQFGDKLPEVFEREAKATARLNHPNIVTLHQFGSWNGLLYLVLERLRGETLATRMERGPITLDEALAIMEAIAKALVHTHAAGITHRDLKPQNVFLVGDGVVKVLDFGVSGLGRMSEHPPVPRGSPGWSTLALAGTPGYMAPEQWDGHAQDSRADLFSFGVMMYQLLVGELPFGIEAIPRGAVAPSVADRVPVAAADLVPLVTQLLATERDERLASAEQVLDQIDGIRAALRVAPPPKAWSIANPRLRVIAALVLVGASISLAVALQTRDRANDSCRATERIKSVWNPTVSARAGDRFGSSSAWDEIRRTIDTYANEWIALDDSACRSKNAAARACLDARLARLGELVASVDPANPSTTLARARALPRLVDCSDPQYIATTAAANKPATRDANALVPYALTIAGTGKDNVHGVAFIDDDLAIVGFASRDAKLSGKTLETPPGADDRFGFVARVTRGGVVRWVQTFTKAAPIAIAVVEGSIVVSGFYNPDATLAGKVLEPAAKVYEGMVISFDASTGAVRWQYSLGMGAPRALASDSDGNLYGAGDYSTLTHDDLEIESKSVEGSVFVASWTRDGELRWVQAAHGTTNSKTYSIAVSDEAVVFGTSVRGKGTMGGEPIGEASCVVGRLERENGEVRWIHHEAGEGRCVVEVVAIAPGRVGMSGQGLAVRGGWVGELAVDDGKLRWTRQLGENEHDRPHALVYGPDGSLVVAGRFEGPTFTLGDRHFAAHGSEDAFIARFDAKGTMTAALGFGGPGGDVVRCAAIDRSGALWVGGRFENTLRIGDRTLFGVGGLEGFLVEISPALLAR